MQLIPISAVPSQNLQIVLAGQNCALSIYTLNGYDFNDIALNNTNNNIYIDLVSNGQPIINTEICLNQRRLLLSRQYLGFVGDLMFVDTQGNDDPQYTGLGTRWVLLYLEQIDIPV